MNNRTNFLGVSKGFIPILRLSVLALCVASFGKATAMPDAEGTSMVTQQNADKKVVTGNVVDANGEPIIGASVVEVGTSNGAVTDIDGNFRLSVGSNSSVQISYIGYITKTVKVSGKTNFNITLEEDLNNLNEVVVVGYGVQRRASVTGSVASIQSKEITTVKTPNVTNTLAGKLPGLRAVQRNGTPGDDAASIDIRGFGSALVIVDGVERNFALLDANDIESISILKDASAAVYGFKGANGVILVTTKKGGLTSKPKFEYNGYVGFSNTTRFPEFYNGYEYATLYNEAQQNIGLPPSYSDELLEQYKQGIGCTDWYDEIVRKNAPSTYHNLSVSGGSEKVKYYVSFGTTIQNGIYRSNGFNYNQYNVRSNLSAEVAKGLTFDLQIAGRLDTRNKPYGDRELERVLQMALPNSTIYANNNPEYWGKAGDAGNPVHWMDKDNAGYNRRDRREFNGTAIINWNIPWVEGLSAKGLFSYDYNNQYDRVWQKEFYEYTYNEATDTYTQAVSFPVSKLTTTSTNYFKPNGQISLNYSHLFAEKHDVGAMLLWEFYNDRNDWVRGYREFTVSAIDQLHAGDNTNKNNDGNAYESAHEGLVGRFNYAYDNKYLVEFSFRYDGSYKFDQSERWGFFPAVSLGWRISEEKWFKEALPMVHNLKIRGSYGKIGDEGDFAAYQYLAGYNYPSGNYVLGTGGLTNGVSDKGLPNTSLTWYESTTSNIGFEASIYQGLFSIEFDYFVRKRDGLLANRLLTLPTTFGRSLPQENLNSDKTKGFEIVLGHHNKIGDFTYDVRANFSTTRNYNRYVERADPTNMYDNWRNNSSYRVKGIQWGYVCEGQFKSYEEILNSPIQDGNGNKSLMPGDLKYQDWNHDGIIDSKDQQPIGHSTTPQMYYGLNLSGSWKDLDLTIFFQGAAGHEVFMTGNFMYPFIQQGLGSGITMWLDRWHRVDPSDPASEWIPGKMPALRPTGYLDNTLSSTWTRADADYLRLKTIEIGYTFPKKWMSRIGIEKLRIYANGFNTLTFTSRKGIMKYMDPEYDNNAFYAYPQQKTINFGANLTF